MKASIVAAMAVMAGAASASAHAHRHAHELFKKHANNDTEQCMVTCTTIYSVVTGEPTLVPAPVTVIQPVTVTPVAPETTVTPETTTTTTATHTSYETVTYTPQPTTEVVVVPVPTPNPYTCETPGTYTFPATTVTVSETTTVCAATSTKVTPGVHTVGGVTTIVKTATTVTCPVATQVTSGSVVHSTITQTEFVCPEAGTYTIAPITTTVTEETVIVYPVPTSYQPGTYTQPEQVVTVTETGFVTYCPYTSSGLPTTTQAPPPPPPKETKPSAPPKETKPAPPKETKPETPKGGSNHGGLRSDGDHLGLTYTPYEPTTGDCKSSDSVDRDIKAIKDAGFKLVRVYSTDCNTLEYVGNACKKHGLQMIIGLFIKPGYTCSYEQAEVKEQMDEIAQWAQWDMTNLVVLSNEGLMNGYCTAQELKELIKVFKNKCPEYKGPVTIAEPLNMWQDKEVSETLCDVVDITGINVHPFFNPNITPAGAGQFVKEQLDILSKICEGKEPINLECGFPKEGSCNGNNCPSKENQAIAIKSIREECGQETVFFSQSDDLWKEKGDHGCEQSWGVASVFGINA